MISRAHPTLLLIICAAALTIVGSRWALIDRDGSPVPFQDQWYAEGEDLYLWAAQGHVPVSHFFQAHNDHHIVPTRLLALALFNANAQWDVRVQMAVNALLAAALMVPLLLLVRPWLPPVGLALVGALWGWFYSQPGLYENALWGFQSEFYFLILFSLAQLFLMLGRPTYSAGWWLGLAAGAAAIGSMGSGLVASAVVALVAGVAWRRAPVPHHYRATTFAATLLTGLGWLWLPSRIAGTPPFAVGPFFHTWIHALGFPQREPAALAWLVWLPFVAFLWRSFAMKREISRAEMILVAVGGWVLLQGAAIGYARPEPGPVLANRYGDILAIGLGVNFTALAWLWSETAGTERTWLRRMFVGTATIAWVSWVGVQTSINSRIYTQSIAPQLAAWRDEQIFRIREFYRTGNRRVLEDAPHPRIPVPDAASLVRDLDFPAMRDALPAELRDPIHLSFPTITGQPSMANATPATLPNEAGALHRGTFFQGAGAAGQIEVACAPAVKHPRRALLFKVAGELRAGETELRIHDAKGQIAATITNFTSYTLRSVIVEVPGPAFSVEVIDRSPTHWLAFLEPVEIGPLSQVARNVLPHGRSVALFGWLVFAGMLPWLLFRAWSERRGSPA